MIRLIKFLLKTFVFLLGIALIAFVMMVGKTYRAEKENRKIGITEAASETADAIKELQKDTDSQTVSDIITYVKGKCSDGSLDSSEEIKNAINDGARSFGVSVSEETANEISKAVENLEKMGFSTEDVMDNVEKTYKKYGEEFMDHMEEVFVESAKEAAGNTARNIWDSIEKTVEQLF